MEAYERINFIQILLTLYNDSALRFFKFPLTVCCILYKKLEEEHAECNLSPPEHECNWSVSMTIVSSMPVPCRNSIRKSTGLVCTAVCRAACMSQAEANQSRRIHPSLTVYQMSISYSWGFFVAWFFYLFVPLLWYYKQKTCILLILLYLTLLWPEFVSCFSGEAAVHILMFVFLYSHCSTCSSVRRGLWHTGVWVRFNLKNSMFVCLL